MLASSMDIKMCIWGISRFGSNQYDSKASWILAKPSPSYISHLAEALSEKQKALNNINTTAPW